MNEGHGLCSLGSRVWDGDYWAGHLLRSALGVTEREGSRIGQREEVGCSAVWVGSSDSTGSSEVGVTL